MKYIDLVIDFRGSQEHFTATCEICKRQGGPEEVPFLIFYKENHNGGSKKRKKACRCLRHRPGFTEGDILLKKRVE
jgi:hypothetical protein